MKSTKFFAMILLCTSVCGCTQKEGEKTSALDKTNMDLSVKPGEDFFRYANGNWLKNHPIPDEYTSYGAFTELSERNEVQLQEIIKEASENTEAQTGSVPQKIRDFYNAGMDSATINSKGYTEILPYMSKIDNINSKDELAGLVGFLHDYGFNSFFYDGSGSDPKQADMVIYQVYQGGLTLPDRDDYLINDSAKIEMRQKYVEHMINMFKLVGIEETAAKAKAENVIAFETRLAEKSLSRVESRDPERTCNKMDLKGLKSLTPIFNWDNYLSTINAPAIDSLNVGSPAFMSGLNENIASTELESIKDYLRWKVITNSAPYMGDAFVQEDFNFFNSFLYGQVEMQPRWRRVLDMTSGCLGEAIGQLYVEKYFPAEAKEKMTNLVGNLKVSLGERIKVLDWMSDETKDKALSKLDKINVKIGYPEKWIDYSNYNVVPDSYFTNVRNAIYFERQRDNQKIGKPIDKSEWYMTPQTVNAYYSPNTNEIVFPAAILQPPFFDMKADDALNYGGIGVVIGHEMTHGFDDQGRKYDEDGNLNDWWTSEDAERFNDRTQQLVKLFSEFELLGHNINGELTLGENIADLGGLNIAWDAFQMTPESKDSTQMDGFTPAQRFFISYATIWRNNIREKALIRRITDDVHSPAEARVNRSLFSMPHFYEAFDIAPEDKLYIAQEERANIW